MEYGKKKFSRKIKLLLYLFSAAIIIKLFSLNTQLVEQAYSEKFYWVISSFFKIIFGWLPFSAGDIFYFLAIIWLIWKLIRFITLLFKNQLSKLWFINAGYKILFIGVIVYLIFNIFWGINYNRKSIAQKLDLPAGKNSVDDLRNIEEILLQKVNGSKQSLINKNDDYPNNKELFDRAFKCYQQAEKTYPFLKYKNISVKSSIYGWWGNYFGFTGYYNPFSGEAQVNTSVPKFMLPYTTCHEMGHQLGFAKEEEANFAGYLAIASSTDTLFQYSAYLDLFVYANRELFFVDSASAKNSAARLLPAVKKDIKEWRDFLRKHKNPVEPIIRWAYGNYLRANQQPKGMYSYDDVITDLIAFYKKFGKI